MSNFAFLFPERPGLCEAASKAEALVNIDVRMAFRIHGLLAFKPATSRDF